MSDRTLAFIDRWRKATNGIDLKPLSTAALASIGKVAEAESLAEAHRLAQESLAEIRNTAPHIASKISHDVYTR
jgi:CHASE1-domain containing sensor protein